jgi:hypothetical protein
MVGSFMLLMFPKFLAAEKLTGSGPKSIFYPSSIIEALGFGYFGVGEFEIFQHDGFILTPSSWLGYQAWPTFEQALSLITQLKIYLLSLLLILDPYLAEDFPGSFFASIFWVS